MNRRTSLRAILLGIITCLFANLLMAMPFIKKGVSPEKHYLSEDAGIEWTNIDVDGQRAAVFSILLDSRKLIWVGTSKGLYLYDGVEMHCVKKELLAESQIYSIVEHGNKLYLGTNHGLRVYQCTNCELDSSSSQKCGEIRSMLDCGDHLLIGSLDGLFSYHFKSKKIENIGKGLPHHSVYSLLRDSHGTLYVGTFSGMAKFDLSAKCFRPINSSLSNFNSSNSFINCMLEAANHQTIFIGTGGGLLSYTPKSNKWTAITGMENTVIKSLAYDSHRNLLIGTNNGLYYLKKNTKCHYLRNTYKANSIAGNQIWATATDSANNIFVGHERGLSITTNSSVSNIRKINSLVASGESNEILAIYRNRKGNLWLGGTNGVIVQKAEGSFHWFHLANDNNTSSCCVRSIKEDSEGTMWLSTDGGIYKYNETTNSFDVFSLIDTKKRISNWVYAICQDKSDFWIGSYLGGVSRVSMSKLSGKEKTVCADFSLTSSNGLANDKVSNVVADGKGNIYILLYGDSFLYHYNVKTHKIERTDIKKITGAEPTHICIDKHQRLWCAYKGGVLIFGQHQTKVVKFPIATDDEAILAMSPVDNGVWVSAKNNLWNVNGNSFSPSIVPIQQKGFNAIWDDSQMGKVILGGLDEITEVDKTSLLKAQEIGKIKMILNYSGGKLNSLKNLIGQSDCLTIPYKGTISLLVSTLDYSTNVKQQIEYRLVKKSSDDEEWIVLPAGSSMITLTSMGFGDYKLQVRTVGSTFPPVSIPIIVNVPFWLSPYALALYFLILLAITSGINWMMHRRTLQRAQEKEREEALANVKTKLAFLSNVNNDMEERIKQLLKTHEELTVQLRLQAITSTKTIEAESETEKILSKVARIVEENIDSIDLKTSFVSEQCGISEKQLYRIFKKHLGITITEYIRKVRLEKAAQLLTQKYFTISEVAYMVGFSSPSYFSKCFQEHYGTAPSTYQT